MATMTLPTSSIESDSHRDVGISWRMIVRDIACMFFGVAAVLTLCVSLPATYAVLAPFHNDGSPLGQLLAIFAVVVFEVGAVGAKLITLAIPEWARRLNVLTLVLLLLTTAANYAHGADLLATAPLASSLAQVRQAGYGPLAAVGAAALFPTLLYVWLSAFVARCKVRASTMQQTVTQRDAQMAQVRQLRAAHDALGTTLRQIEIERDTLAAQVRHASGAEASAFGAVRQVETERDALAAQIGHIVQERDALAAQVREAGSVEATLHGTVRQIEQELRTMERTRDALESELRQQAEDVEQNRATVLALPDALELEISGKRYTTRQLESVLDIPEATLRRKLKQVA